MLLFIQNLITFVVLKVKKEVIMSQLILNIENPDILPSLRKVLSQLKGVTIVGQTKEKNHLDLALEDVKNGKVKKVDSVEDLMNYLNE